MSRIVLSIHTKSSNLGKLSEKKFSKIFDGILEILPSSSDKVELLLVESREMQSLNKTFRGKNKPTDVLSFPFSNPELLGSIVIDIETAREQAKYYSQSFERETYELFIHGILHLLGMDHEYLPGADLMKSYEQYFSRVILGNSLK